MLSENSFTWGTESYAILFPSQHTILWDRTSYLFHPPGQNKSARRCSICILDKWIQYKNFTSGLLFKKAITITGQPIGLVDRNTLPPTTTLGRKSKREKKKEKREITTHATMGEGICIISEPQGEKGNKWNSHIRKGGRLDQFLIE